MSVKDNWKKFGKNVGSTVVDFGKAVVRTAKVAATKLDDESTEEEKQDTGLKEKWTKVGKDFGETGKSLGTAAKSTADKVFNDEKPLKPENEIFEEGENKD